MIATFYSYKGGVGRSMALANVADLLARSGLRVLIVDFDLEAPGLEHFFPIDHDQIRGQEGLLDLLLAFKYSMSVASPSSGDGDTFRQLDRFVSTVYPAREGGGSLDILPAGQRLTDEQISRYGVELRRFDWLDFYFVWSGELFFEWLRRVFADRYDIVLVDSRTGVTEMGGVCAYQLADIIIVLCAPNLQNVEGTEAMVRHFLSPQVLAVRGDRPVDVLIVPARVDQEDTALRRTFERRFDETFVSYLPAALAAADVTLWDLQIPYEPRYAFDEQVVTDPERAEDRQGLAAAYEMLLRAIALLAPDNSALVALRRTESADGEKRPRGPVETRYDPTTRFAAADVFISFGSGSEEIAGQLQELLIRDTDLVVMALPGPSAGDAAFTRASSDLVQTAKLGLVLVSRQPDWSQWQQREIEQLLSHRQRPVLPVILPGADPDQIPPSLKDRVYLDFRAGVNAEQLLASVRAALVAVSLDRPQPPRVTAPPSPYPGLVPFREADQRFFFGREAEVDAMLDRLRRDGVCPVVGPAGIGKTSVVMAGLVPALRRGRLPGSERWPIVVLRPGPRPMSALVQALGTLVPPTADSAPDRVADNAASLGALLHERFERVVLVVDQFEELFAVAEAFERDRFVSYLVALCGRAGAVVAPVIVLRADFLSEAATDQVLAQMLFPSLVAVGKLSDEGLRAAISGPAELLGVAFEPGLVEKLVADVAGEPGALPVLQLVLHQLWQAQRDGYLTHQSYEGRSGLVGALVYQADQLMTRLSPVEQRILQQVFLRLIVPGEGAPDRSRLIEMNELTAALESQGLDPTDVRRVVELLVDERLLVATIGGEDQQPQIGIVHEALINAWPALREWIEQTREELQARSRLHAAVQEWQASGHDSAALLPLKRLEQLLSKMPESALSSLQREYVQAAREATMRSRRRLRRLAVGLMVLLLIAVTASLVAVTQRNSARSQAQLATSRLAAEAISNLDDHLDRSLLLSLEALRAAPTVEARSALLAGLQHSPELVSSLQSETAAVRSVAFSPDGRTLASAGADEAALLWDVTQRTRLGSLTGHKGAVTSVAFSPDGRTLASGGADTTVILWDVQASRRLGESLTGHTSAVTSVAFSPDGRTLASGSRDGTVVLWDVARRARLGILSGHSNAVSGVAFSPDGRTLASGSRDRTVMLWDVVRRGAPGRLIGRTDAVTSVAFSPDGRTLASGSLDRTVILWDVQTRRRLGPPLTGHTGAVTGVAFSPDGRILASGSLDRTVILWDVQTRRRLGRPLTGHNGAVTSVAFSPDGSILASGNEGNTIVLFNVQIASGAVQSGPRLGESLTGHLDAVASVAFSPDGRMLASGSDDKTVILWDVARRVRLSTLKGHADAVASVAFSPDGRTLASGSDDRTVVLWDVARQVRLSRLTGHKGAVASVAYSPDGRTLASGSVDGTVMLWDVARPARLDSLTGHNGAVSGVAFSPDGTTLASGGADGTLLLWDVQTRRQLGESLTGHTGAVTSVDFSPDGTMLASGSLDRTVTLWDVARRARVGSLAGHNGAVRGVAFSPDSRTLASGSDDRKVLLWDVRLESWRQLGCTIANRNLTRAEWNQFIGSTRTYRRTCPDLPSG